MQVNTKIADAFASIEELVDDVGEEYRKRVETLLAETDGRIDTIWEAAGADLTVTINMLVDVPVFDRMQSEEWDGALKSMIAAAREQAFVEILFPALLPKADKHARRVRDSAASSTDAELKQAAKDGTTKDEMEAAKQRRKTRTMTT